MAENVIRLARRSFFSRLGIAAILGAPSAAEALAGTQSTAGSRWQATQHEQDNWLEKIPGQHRLVFDTTLADGLGMALQFAGNFYTANRNDYGLQDNDLAVLIILRSKSTSFGYNNAMWAKYGKQFAQHANFTDPKTKEPPSVNFYLTADTASPQASRMDGLLKRGVQLGVCKMATRNISGMISRASGTNQDMVFDELSENLLDNARLVPAGIVAVSRAQERGYTIVHGI
jgi:intracellular sulfur oxidation DsrE/DsrF family protein